MTGRSCGRILAALLALFTLAACTPTLSESPAPPAIPSDNGSGGNRPDGEDPLMNVTSLELARMMGPGINLGNTMEACNIGSRVPNRDPSVYETMWGNPVTTQEMITGMRNAGFKTLRIPVAWTNAMDIENGNLTINDAYLRRVEEIVNYALNEDMFVIVNAHWDHGWWSMFGHPDQEVRDYGREVFVSMWTQIGERFQDYDLRLIFEPSNEEWGDRFNDRTALWSPDGGTLTQSECYALLTELSQVFVDLIRSSGGNNPGRFLLMKGYNTDVMRTVDNRFRLPTDTAEEKLLLSVHYYTPWSYVGDRASTAAWGTVAEVEEMNHLLGLLTKYTDMGYGIVLGEWGVLDNDGDDRLKFFTNFLDNADYYGYVPVLWDTGGLFDRWVTKAISAPEIGELFLSRSSDARAGMTAEEIIAAARANMELTLQRAADRPMFILGDDEAIAWIMFNSSDWSVGYNNEGNQYRPESMTKGIAATDVEVTGPGTYTVALDFTGISAGFANGIVFSAVAIANGEDLFPDYIINVIEVLINGEPAELTGRPYTSTDGNSCTRANLYNNWVPGIPASARIAGGDLSDATPTALANYRSANIRTLEVTFEFMPPA